jgi:hypothetical protein
MSFLIFGLWHFEGVKWGTVVCALINGWIIGRFSALYEKHWTFCDRFAWRRFLAPDDKTGNTVCSVSAVDENDQSERNGE